MGPALLQLIFGDVVVKSSHELIQLLHCHECLLKLEFQRDVDDLGIFQQNIHRDQKPKLLHEPLNQKVLEFPPL